MTSTQAQQIHNGIILYEVIADDYFAPFKGQKKPTEYMIRTNKMVTDGMNQLHYTMRFDKNLSEFKITKEMAVGKEVDKYVRNLAKLYAGDPTYFNDIDKNHYIQTNEHKGMTYNVLKSMERDQKWELSKESKEILGYTCYKATIRIQEEPEIRYTLWYAPSIPFAHAPLKQSNQVPGLVLEFNNSNRIIYTATSIKTNIKDLKLKWPTGIQLMDETTYKEAGDAYYEGIKKNE